MIIWELMVNLCFIWLIFSGFWLDLSEIGFCIFIGNMFKLCYVDEVGCLMYLNYLLCSDFILIFS